MQRFLLNLLFLSLLSTNSYGQGENNVWIFGGNYGLDFNSTRPTVFPLTTGRGYAGVGSVSDAAGQLLFYTNGDSVWNRKHQVMPNGHDLHSAHGIGVTSAIIPAVDHPGQYHLFTIDPWRTTLNYSLVDLSLDNGLGDIVPGKKAVAIDSNISAGITAVRGAGCYIWLVAHRIDRNEFVLFRIDGSGISAAPVTSSSGFVSSVGHISVSPDGQKLAVAYGGNRVSLHDFNSASGNVSQELLLDFYGEVGRSHALCFSPDSRKLYVSGGVSGSDLIQYDLDKLPAVSMTKINDSSYFNGDLRIGPDENIYCAKYEGVYAILNPNAAGKACSLSYNYLNLPDTVMSQSFTLGNNVILPAVTYASHLTDTVVCKDQPIVLQAPEGYARYLWNDEDTSSSKAIVSNNRVWVKSSGMCKVITDTFNVTVSDCNCIITIPDAFTPNDDGHNDMFRPLGYDAAESELSIYNRYGQRIFHSYGQRPQWDGTFEGKSCDMGSYFYFLRVKCLKGQMVVKKGEITLLR